MKLDRETFADLRDSGYPEEALRAYEGNIGSLDMFEDAYIGEYDAHSEEGAVGEFIYEMSADCGQVLGEYSEYINWDAVGRDAIMNGEFWASRGPSWGSYFVFHNI